MWDDPVALAVGAVFVPIIVVLGLLRLAALKRAKDLPPRQHNLGGVARSAQPRSSGCGLRALKCASRQRSGDLIAFEKPLREVFNLGQGLRQMHRAGLAQLEAVAVADAGGQRAEPDRRHSGRATAPRMPPAAILDHETVAGIDAEFAGGDKTRKMSGCGLCPRATCVAAVNVAALELSSPASSHAKGKSPRVDRIELDEAMHRGRCEKRRMKSSAPLTSFRSVSKPLEGGLLEISSEKLAGSGLPVADFDFSHHVDGPPAGIARQRLIHRGGIAETADGFRQYGIGDRFAVGDHAVEIKNQCAHCFRPVK